jgi:hypothetical protein
MATEHSLAVFTMREISLQRRAMDNAAETSGVME